MSTINAVPFRSTIFYTAAGVPAATGSVLTIGSNGVGGFTTNLGSTMVSIGASTNQTYNNFTNGSYVTWQTAKSAMTSANKTVQSANGLYQLVVANTTSNLSLSSDSGITWSTLTGGLPTLTGSAYWSDGAISANGQHITLSMYGGSLWMSQDYGRTFALTNQPTPNIWLPLNGNTTDLMGSSTVTAPGTVPGYVTVNYPGYTAQAVNLLNTAGSNATRYIRGTWTGSPNFTVSFWMNPQTVNGSQQTVFSTYTGGIQVYIQPSTNYLFYQIPSGGASGVINGQVVTTYALSVNTWYYITIIFQTNGLCSLYINNTLIGSATNVGGYGTYVPTPFSLGTYDIATTNAFNGYVADLRITNSVSTYVPIPLLQPNIWMPFENSTADLGSNAITPTVTGSLSYVPGVVGLNAVNLVNPAGGTPSNYISGSWPALTVCTVSGWFNIQSFSTTANQFICSLAAATGSIIIYIDLTSRKLFTQLGVSQSSIGNALSLNTWYYFQLTVSSSSSATLYLNSDSVTFTYTAGGSAGGGFSIGTYSAGGYAFNGYIDDFRIYNAAIPYHVLFPQNYRSLALSGTGQYALAAAASGWVVGSSNAGQTWSKQAVSVGTNAPNSSSLALNHTGQYQLVATGPAAGNIMPNQTGLTTASWTQGGVNWTASASSALSSPALAAYGAFNNTLSVGTAYSWGSNHGYSSSSPYACTSGVSTTILGIGATAGEWLQLQTSVPIVMQSYTYGCAGAVNLPKNYYIVGSNDGSTWYPIQYAAMTTSPFTANFQLASTYITVNQSGTQTITGAQTGSGSFTTYTTTTNAYTYFRIVITNTFASTLTEFGEWYINFANSVSYSTNYGSTWLNTSRTVSNESVALSASGQYALSTNSVVPLARLTLDNTNVDAQGSLVPATGAGTVTYSTSIKAVGTHSAQFANTAGGNVINYLNYTVPAVFNKPSALTMSYWVYPTSLSSSGSAPIGFNNGGTTAGPGILCWSDRTECFIYNTSGSPIYATYSSPVSINAWTHLTMTFNIGILTLYVNGISRATTTTSNITLNLSTNNNITNLFLGGLWASSGYAFAGYVDDVRLYTSALNADEINGLFKNPALTQTIAVSSSYLPITSYLEPTLPGITANIVDAAVSQTGQYMVAVTSSTTNNVYYSTDFGATFTALTVGTSAMVSCSISYDGSYLTVENATTVYTLNRNTRGFSVTVGNQAGLINQAQNAIAIGDKAGQTNQSANSIVINATGTALDAAVPGFYVAPVATAASSSAAPFNLLGYGTDNQIVQSSALTVLQNGNMGIGTTNPYGALHVYGNSTGKIIGFISNANTALGSSACLQYGLWPLSGSSQTGTNSPSAEISAISLNAFNGNTDLAFSVYTGVATTPNYTLVERMRITAAGNVGIGTATPSANLHIYNSSASFTGAPTVHIGDGQADAGGTYGMVNLVRANNAADNKAHLSFIKNGLSVFGMGFFPGTGLSVFGLVPSFSTMNVSAGLWIDNTGSVGIGSTAPGSRLDVSGTILGRTRVASSVFTTITIANTSFIEYTVADLGCIATSTVYYVTAIATDTGQYYAHAVFYNWNPALQALTSIFNSGITFSIGTGAKLRLTNTTGATKQFNISIIGV